MPEFYLKVTGKQRTIDDVKDGITHKLTLVKKEGKKGEPTYGKIQLVFEEGTKRFYDALEVDELVLVKISVPQSKMEAFTGA